MTSARIARPTVLSALLALLAAGLFALPVAVAQEPPSYDVTVRNPDPPPPKGPQRMLPEAPDENGTDAFARVRYEEGGLRVSRKGEAAADLGANSPLYVGDRIEATASQRGEIQLPDGSIVRLDGRTLLDLFQFADHDRGARNESVLALSFGSLQLDVPELRGGATLRIDTPSASIYPSPRSAFRIDVEDGAAVRVSVERGRVEVSGEDGSVVVRAGERTRVASGAAPRRPWDYNVSVRDGFDAWVARRDDVYALRGESGREYSELPPAVRPYYAELSRHGKWVWSDEYGWTWKPDVDDDWRPYVRGSWDDGPYGPVWVGVEPWSWSVYRYGRWGWRAGWGWYWIPGQVFAPHWVYWYYGPSYVGWVPLGYWNRPVYVSIGWGWGDPWFDGSPWCFVRYDRFWYRDVHRVHVSRRDVLPRDLRDGVVGVRPVRDSASIRTRGTLGRDRGLGDDTFERVRDRARSGAGSGTRGYTAVRDLDSVRRGDGDGARPTSFRERERGRLERAAGERGERGDRAERGEFGDRTDRGGRPGFGERSGGDAVRGTRLPGNEADRSGREARPERERGIFGERGGSTSRPERSGAERGRRDDGQAGSPAAPPRSFPTTPRGGSEARGSESRGSESRGSESRGSESRGSETRGERPPRSEDLRPPTPPRRVDDADTSVRRFLGRIAEDDRRGSRGATAPVDRGYPAPSERSSAAPAERPSSRPERSERFDRGGRSERSAPPAERYSPPPSPRPPAAAPSSPPPPRGNEGSGGGSRGGGGGHSTRPQRER